MGEAISREIEQVLKFVLRIAMGCDSQSRKLALLVLEVTGPSPHHRPLRLESLLHLQ